MELCVHITVYYVVVLPLILMSGGGGRYSCLVHCGGGPPPAAPPTTTVTTPAPEPLDSLACSFDKASDTCGLSTGSRPGWTTTDGKIQGNYRMPAFDHTSGTGFYLYPVVADTTEEAVLVTPVFAAASHYCLTFFYTLNLLFGGNFIVYMNDTASNFELLWRNGISHEGSNQDNWIRAEVPLKPSADFQIIFNTSSTSYLKLMGLDDINITQTMCLKEQAQSELKCDFEEEDLCGFGQPFEEDDFDWIRNKGITLSSSTGPADDRTLGEGHYMYLEASDFKDEGHTVVLESPQILPKSDAYCVQMFYMMYGNTVGNLTLLVAFGNSSDTGAEAHPQLNVSSAQEIWSVTEETEQRWYPMCLTLKTPSPFKMFIRGAIVGDSFRGDLAIDDIAITPGECERYKQLVCAFDSLCGFTQSQEDDFDWLLGSGTTPTLNTGPASGTYVYIEASAPRTAGQKAVLASPLLEPPPTQLMCLVLWYHMYGDTMGMLRVLMQQENSTTPATPLFNLTNNQGDRYQRVYKTLDSEEAFKILLEATVGAGELSDIAVWEFSVTPGPCADQQGGVESFECTFDKPDQCSFDRLAEASDFLWRWHSGPARQTGNSGPSSGHGGEGRYMYVDSSSPQSVGQKATLASPLVQALAEAESAETSGCLSFWYHMQVPSGAALEVGWESGPGNLSTVWSRSGNQSNDWVQGFVDVTRGPDASFPSSAFRFVFQASVDGSDSDIALDDIHFTSGHCQESGSPSVNCSFDDGYCGWTQSAEDDFDWVLTSEPCNVYEPTANSTEGASGSYMCAREYIPSARLLSPVLSWAATKGCLTFYYTMIGDTLGSLNVYQTAEGVLSDTDKIFSVSSESGDWKQASIDVNTDVPVQFVFEVVRGPGERGDIGVDSIKMLPGVCGGAMLSCDLEDNVCGFLPIIPMGSGVYWQRQANDTITDRTGPRNDATQTGDGYFVYLETSSGSENDTAILKSPLVDLGLRDLCLDFWYHMDGDDVNTLTLFTADKDNLTVGRQDLWSKEKDLDNQWHNAQADFSVPTLGGVPQATRFYFEGTRGAAELGDIALDDITIRPGLCGDCTPPTLESTIDCGFDGTGCRYTPLDSDLSWRPSSGSTPTGGTGPTGPHSGSGYIFAETSLPIELQEQRAFLTSPILTGDPQKICVRFRVWMLGEGVGTVSLATELVSSGAQKMVWERSEPSLESDGWISAEITVDMPEPLKLHFLAKRRRAGERMLGSIAIDDVEVNNGTCQPVPFTDEWSFRCDRPNSQCVGGTCNNNTKQCDCDPGAMGLQCQAPIGTCPGSDPCERGVCYNSVGEPACACPDGYYGDTCEHQMVNAECDDDKMIINIFPYGFSEAAFRDVMPPETITTGCPLRLASTSIYGNRGWEGYVGEFQHVDDQCDGNATVVNVTEAGITYSRQLLVYYDYLGRHETDTVLNVTCFKPFLPPPKVEMTAVNVPESRGWKTNSGWVPFTYAVLKFKLNIPNNAGLTEMKIERCVGTFGTRQLLLVDQGCASRGVGALLFDGAYPAQQGEDFLYLRVFRQPTDPLSFSINCNVRLCDGATDFACYQRSTCAQPLARKKRSTSFHNTEEVVDLVYNPSALDQLFGNTTQDSPPQTTPLGKHGPALPSDLFTGGKPIHKPMVELFEENSFSGFQFPVGNKALWGAMKEVEEVLMSAKQDFSVTNLLNQDAGYNELASSQTNLLNQDGSYKEQADSHSNRGGFFVKTRYTN